MKVVALFCSASAVHLLYVTIYILTPIHAINSCEIHNIGGMDKDNEIHPVKRFVDVTILYVTMFHLQLFPWLCPCLQQTC